MLKELTQHIAIVSVSLYVPEAQSLKQKRMILRSLKDRIRNKFNVSIAELDGQDKWQRSTLGFAMIGTDNRYMDSCLQNMLSYIHDFHGCEVCDHVIEFV